MVVLLSVDAENVNCDLCVKMVFLVLSESFGEGVSRVLNFITSLVWFGAAIVDFKTMKDLTTRFACRLARKGQGPIDNAYVYNRWNDEGLLKGDLVMLIIQRIKVDFPILKI
ncbi:hypothetical protein M9H77_26483 [Catharanthus roseus]|uniref:Uncharacterized protein n=1 Tax=Catharanthus roseus TaxID=4058 RepID=A0ACC0ABB9_CATRO|nr:hypothetical protein M9H77_26483 [Catharanthus roseus]